MDKKFVALMMVFFLVFGVFITSTLFNKQIANFARASTETDPSAQTSLIFAWPLTAKIGDKVDVNVFIRNANNLPLDKKLVKVVTDLGTIDGAKESTAETDKTGHVNFKLTTDTPCPTTDKCTANITAFVTDTSQVSHQLNQTVTVKFE